MLNWVSLLPTIISAISAVRGIVEIAQSNDDIVAKIKQSVPKVAAALEEYGSIFFPGVAPELHIAAAAMTAYNEDWTKGVQVSLNALVKPSPNLEIDGFYGQKTMAAAKALQTQYGLNPDGWVGKLTLAAIAGTLTKPTAVV